jgi:hypothetical protein
VAPAVTRYPQDLEVGDGQVSDRPTTISPEDLVAVIAGQAGSG